jgi:hypothetical protein
MTKKEEKIWAKLKRLTIDLKNLERLALLPLPKPMISWITWRTA